MKDPDHPLEAELHGLVPRAPEPASRDQLRAALRNARAEETLAAMVPAPPSAGLRERIAGACHAERAAERQAVSAVPQGSAVSAVLTLPAKDTAPAQPGGNPVRGSRPLRIGAGIFAAAAAIALAWFGMSQLGQPGSTPEEVVEESVPPVPANAMVDVPEAAGQAVDKNTFPLPYAPVSAERVFVEAENGGIKHIDGRPVQVVHVKLLDKLEYEQSGRRVVVERPVRQTVYNQLAYH